MAKRIKKLLIPLLVLAGIGLIVAHFQAPYLVARTNDPINKLRKLQAAHSDPGGVGLDFDSFSIVTNDQLTLKGYFIPKAQAKGTIIMLHGIRAYKEHFIQIASRVHQEGFNLVLLDNRAHGQSDGEYCTFGVKEKEDVSVLIDYLIAREVKGSIGLWGQSLGGAIALQSMAHDHRVSFGIIESTFTQFSIIADDYFVRFAPFVPKWYRSYLINKGAKLADFDPQDAQPIVSATQITQPVFMAHGSIDNRIDVKYASELFEAIPATTKELYIIEGANHVNVWQTGGEQYFTRVFDFLENIID